MNLNTKNINKNVIRKFCESKVNKDVLDKINNESFY